VNIWAVGGTGGIGSACKQELERAGHTVSASGSEADVIALTSLRDYAREFGPFDGILYAAGVNFLDFIPELDAEEMLDVLNTNVCGLQRVLQVHYEQQGDMGMSGRVVVIGSDAAWRPMRTSAAYNASKAALHAYCQCVAREWASDTFRINVVAAGLVWGTAMTEYVRERTEKVRGWTPQSLDDYMVAQIPMGRPAYPEEIAEVVGWLFDVKTPYLNGAIIPVNGAR
jgi:NAD(P)-dependent dehydrogenase (short-subunit alcohol dehydrogenase family)